MSFTSELPSHPTTARFLSLAQVQEAALWIFVFSGFVVVIEPAPYDLLFLLTLGLFLPAGLSVHKPTAPLVVFLLLFTLGGFASLVPVLHLPKTSQFFVTSFYMAISAIFFCFCIAGDPLRRMAIIRNAYIWAGVAGATTGLIGYFNIAGMGEAWAPISRAQGTFKDPNVLSTFLVPPAVFLIQGFLLRTQRWRLVSTAALAIILAALLFALSRGAWVNWIMAVLLLVGLTFITTPSPALRGRILALAILGAILLVAGVSFALSFEGIRELFAERANIVNPYDVGEFGRFGTQLRSLSTVLESPNGFGPTQFRVLFGQDPHNVFLNAFVSYGWLGGFSYALLILSSFVAGWRAVFMKTPWQHHAIAVFSLMVAVILQGVQIDTDHWRHFYLLVGLTWGFYAASMSTGVARAGG